MDDRMSVIGDWAQSTDPSPRTLMASFLSEEFSPKPLSDLMAENEGQKTLPVAEQQKILLNSKEECSEDGFNFSGSFSLEPGLVGGQKSRSRGGLAQRMARSGFSAPTINTERIKSANMASSSEVRSPYLTIPPGLSPTTLLDSPVFLCNSMVQPSPTTGKLSFMANVTTSLSISDSVVLQKSEDDHPGDAASGGFAFKPPLDTKVSYFSNPENKQPVKITEDSTQKSFAHPIGFTESTDKKDSGADSTICLRPTDSSAANELSPPLEDHMDGEGEMKGEFSSSAVNAPAEDGFNWRKYGQKQVKGSEYPRSYYKCTHPNCPVKKKVERSHEGHITEIIYKGAHNHTKPLPNRRSGVPFPHQFNGAQIDGLEHPGSLASFDGKPSAWAGDSMDATSTASGAAEFGDPSASLHSQDGSHFGSPEAIDISSTVSNDEEEEDRATHGSASLGGDIEGDESESKRRKLDVCAIEMNTAASRAVREPRVVVQTTSEVDILDDGYRWRKYGQKVVKGNPNPRSYYKCTNSGCTVRKHVERAYHDLKSVITTYEGKHNHEVPVARNSGHSNSGASTAAHSTTQSQNLHRKSEPTQDSLMRFNGHAPLSSFSFPAREQQLGLGPNFSLGMGQPGLPNFAIGGFGSMNHMLSHYMGQQASNAGAGFMVPKGEPKEEPVAETGHPMSNGMTAYHQLLSRLPLGPPL